MRNERNKKKWKFSKNAWLGHHVNHNRFSFQSLIKKKIINNTRVRFGSAGIVHSLCDVNSMLLTVLCLK